MAKITFKKMTLDARKDGVEQAERLARRFVDAKGRLTERDTGRAINRSASSTSRHVQRLAKIMLTGRWKEDISQFVRTKKGYLKDGRQRCLAFIEAAKINPSLKISFWMKDGIEDKDAYAISSNSRGQSARDLSEANGLEKTHGSIAKYILNRGLSSKAIFIAEESLETAENWKREMSLVQTALNGAPRIATAPVIAALVRALINTRRKKDVLRFCEILTGGIPNPKRPWEANAYSLARTLLSKVAHNNEDCFRTYRLTEAGFDQFINRVKIHPSDSIRIASKELYPLPGEAVQDAGSKPVMLVPVVGTAGKLIGQTIDRILKGGNVPLHGVAYKRIPPRTKICLFVPAQKRIIGTGIVQKVGMNVKHVLEMTLSKIEPKSADITIDKLFNLSIAQKRMPDLQRMSKEITKINESDVKVLVG